MDLQFATEAQLCKVVESDDPDELGLVFGFAAVSLVDGEPYFDDGCEAQPNEKHHIPEAVLLKAATEFMDGDRDAFEMHENAIGKVLFAFPLMSDIADALGILTKRTGLLIGMRPNSAESLAKFKGGDYRGFSIGGYINSTKDA